jgi:uncharacterized membrane protein
MSQQFLSCGRGALDHESADLAIASLAIVTGILLAVAIFLAEVIDRDDQSANSRGRESAVHVFKSVCFCVLIAVLALLSTASSLVFKGCWWLDEVVSGMSTSLGLFLIFNVFITPTRAHSLVLNLRDAEE